MGDFYSDAAIGNWNLEKLLRSLGNQFSNPVSTGNTYVVVGTTNANYQEFVNSFDVTAANVSIANCRFVCGIDAQLAMFNVTGTDFNFVGNEVFTNTGTVGA